MSCCDDTESDEGVNDRPKVRGCTDVFWLIIYILFWFVMAYEAVGYSKIFRICVVKYFLLVNSALPQDMDLIFIAAFALVYGNPVRLINGYDSFGNTCGTDLNDKMGNLTLSGINTTTKRYLFFMDVKNIRNSLQICVEKCPDRRLNSMQDIKDFYKETGSDLCRYDFDLLTYNGTDHNLDESVTITSSVGPCPQLPVYKSIPVLNRCVPEAVKSVATEIIRNVYSLLNSWDFGEQMLHDLYFSWKYILGLTLLALVLSLLMVSLFYLIASFVACIIMVAVSLSVTVGTGFLWMTYFEIKKQLDNTPESQILEETVHNEQAFCVYAIIATIFSIIILLLVLALRKRVDFVALLFKEAADCLHALPSLYLQPVFSFIQLIIFYIFWISVVACLLTANYPGAKPLRPFSSESVNAVLHSEQNFHMKSAVPARNVSVASLKIFTIVQYADATWVRYMWWVYFIGLVWTSEFILACQQMVIAGAVAMWYFNGKKTEPKSPVWTSFKHLICYHLGSVALGSLLITIFKVPRLVLSYIYAKLKQNEENSVIAKCMLKCCICCLYCFENFLRYINHNAYTVIAMQSINFCPAANRAWHVIVTNALRLATLNSVGDFILFLGKVIVTAVTGCTGLLIFRQDPELHFYAVPTLVTLIFAFFVAHSVISLYETVIDTLFLCICEDQTINKEEGPWKQSALAAVAMSKPGSSVPELSPMNEA